MSFATTKKKPRKKVKRKESSEKRAAFVVPYIDPEEITFTKLLGCGCFGKVFAGECRSIEVAVKIPQKQNLSKRALQNFTKEVEIMSKIYHPNVCLFMGACIEPGQIRIVSEKLETDLEEKLHDMNVDIRLTQRIQWAKEMSQGIAWLHGSDPPIIHRDLKPANLLVDEHNKIKVCDFGLSQFMEDTLFDSYNPKGTPLYMAPEVMRKEEITEKVDVYSVGVIIWELLTRDEPFADHSDYEIFVDAVCNDGERPIIPRWCPDTLRSIITDCWQEDPNARPAMAEVVTRLDACIQDCAEFDFSQQIDNAVSDPAGRLFWKKIFPTKLSVGWPEFARKFYGELCVDLPHDPQTKELTPSSSDTDLQIAGKYQLKSFAKISSECAKRARAALKQRVKKGSAGELYRLIADDCQMNDGLRTKYAIKALLNADITEVVTVDDFGKLLEWLGPLEIPSQNNGFLDRVGDLTCQPWFHGDLATKQAENLLRLSSPGTFLVRFSNSSRGTYCISRVTKSKTINHLPFPYQVGVGIEYKGRTYKGICEFVTAKKEQLYLNQPVAMASKFAWLYAESVLPVIGYVPAS